MNILKMIIGSRNERYIKSRRPVAARINDLEPAMRELADGDFAPRVAGWRQEVANGRPIDELLPEVFALVRESGRRKLDMRHFDVQLIGGMVLHEGKISEMKTGEGKTLVATLPIVLNALTGKGVHLVTVNDYLARRDARWMGQIYEHLGLSVGVVVHGQDEDERRAAYGADITYGTNNEFGFDYLRDNMKFYKENLVQREMNYAIVDEVDSILIDEARTPLIISGPTEESSQLYRRVNSIVPRLKRWVKTPEEVERERFGEKLRPDGDFEADEKSRSVTLTDQGVTACERLLSVENLYDAQNMALQHHVLQALKAHHLFKHDVDYIVSEDQVVIVDEFTGRLMPGRRFSDGLHQALEAKEGVKVEAENQTLASITFQNFFRMYDKLAGMTGTADTESVEFRQIYNLEVMVVPTHRDMIRLDRPDLVYKTQREKFEAVVADIEELHRKGQPVLVGTVSIEKSELLAKLLKKRGVPHNVLNAKHHEMEAEIVAEAGQSGKVTIATNMAGRGTDIVLGPGVIGLGGLHIIGTERHESRRIDNQLRGRSGRQGDPGSSRFYLALDDDLMRLFGSDRIAGIMGKLGMAEGEAIENRMVSRAIESSQKRVEAHNFEIRKQLLEYDNVMNQQREVIYARRRELMFADNPEMILTEYVQAQFEDCLAPLIESKEPDEETVALVRARLDEAFDLSRFPEFKGAELTRERCQGFVDQVFGALEASSGEHFPEIVRYFILESLDRNWKEHLLNMDHLRDGIGLRGYGQKDPKQEYKREGFELFQEMLYSIQESTVRGLARLRIQAQVSEEEFQHREQAAALEYSGPQAPAARKPSRRDAPKVGRNDPCPCGSGKKHKKCCGK